MLKVVLATLVLVGLLVLIYVPQYDIEQSSIDASYDLTYAENHNRRHIDCTSDAQCYCGSLCSPGDCKATIAASGCNLPGDVDGDGAVTCADVSCIRKEYTRGEVPCTARKGRPIYKQCMDLSIETPPDGIINENDYSGWDNNFCIR